MGEAAAAGGTSAPCRPALGPPDLRAAASRACTCTRPRRRLPFPGATARPPAASQGSGLEWGAHHLPRLRAPRGTGAARRRALCLCGPSEGYGSGRGALAPPAEGQGQSPGPVPRQSPLGTRRYWAQPSSTRLYAFSLRPPPPPCTLPPTTTTTPASPALRSPALRDPRAAAHGRWAAESEHHARPGVGAQLAPRRLQQRLACGALPCAPGGGPRCREREAGERELGGGDWAGGGAGRASAAAPEAALAPITETQARRRPSVGVRISVHTSVHAHVCTTAGSWLLVRALAPRELGLVILTPRLL